MKGFFCSLLILALIAGAACADMRVEAGGYALTFDEQVSGYGQNVFFGMDMVALDTGTARDSFACFLFIMPRLEGMGPDSLQDLQKGLEAHPSEGAFTGFRLVPEVEPQFLLHYTCADEAYLAQITAVADSFEIVPDRPLAFYVPADGALERREIEGRLTPMALTDALNAAGAFPEPVAADAISIGPRGAQVYLDGAFQSMLDRADADAEALYRKSLEDTFRENYRVETVHLFFHSGSSAGTDAAD